jgi:hypothetical protein
MVTAINNNVNTQGQASIRNGQSANPKPKNVPIDFSQTNPGTNATTSTTTGAGVGTAGATSTAGATAGAAAPKPNPAQQTPKTPKNQGKGFFAGISEKLTNLKNAIFKKSKTAAPAANSTANAVSNGAGKVASKLKGKGGKIGIIAAIGTALLVGGAWLYNKIAGQKDAEENQKIKDALAQEAEEESTETNAEKQPGVGKSEDKPETTAPETTDDAKNPDTTDVKTEHTVVKGDNMWNIAKQHLKDLKNDPDYKPTNAEIAKHTQELIELNGLKYEPDGYVVIIRPDDVIKLA